jgi:SAM-dependent methyltransferase
MCLSEPEAVNCGLRSSAVVSSAADCYAQHRPGYPQSLVDALAARAGLDGTQRVLDVGCGTGQLTIPLARHAQAVVAIDPVAAMQAHGRQAAQASWETTPAHLAGTSARPSWTCTPQAWSPSRSGSKC